MVFIRRTSDALRLSPYSLILKDFVLNRWKVSPNFVNYDKRGLQVDVNEFRSGVASRVELMYSEGIYFIDPVKAEALGIVYSKTPYAYLPKMK
jgi:hypothetical protein